MAILPENYPKTTLSIAGHLPQMRSLVVTFPAVTMSGRGHALLVDICLFGGHQNSVILLDLLAQAVRPYKLLHARLPSRLFT